MLKLILKCFILSMITWVFKSIKELRETRKREEQKTFIQDEN